MKNCGDWCCPKFADRVDVGIDGTSGSMSLALRQYAMMVKSVICHRQDDAKRRNNGEEL
jgi:hypothetical protein